jgi:hypothetical protein
MSKRGHGRGRVRGSAAICLAAMIGMGADAASAGSATSTLEQACAAYDLQVVTLIEDHGIVEEFPASDLVAAALQMLVAREACRSGDPARGLEIYDSIPLHRVRMSPLYRIQLN